MPVLPHFFNNQRLYGVIRELLVVPLIVRLSAVTKQPAEKPKGTALELSA